MTREGLPCHSIRLKARAATFVTFFAGIAVINASAAGSGGTSPGAASPISDVFEFSIEHVRVDSLDGFDVMGYAGAEADIDPSRIGHPQLPVKVYQYALPAGTSNVSIEILEADTLEGEYLPLPI